MSYYSHYTTQQSMPVPVLRPGLQQNLTYLAEKQTVRAPEHTDSRDTQLPALQHRPPAYKVQIVYALLSAFKSEIPIKRALASANRRDSRCRVVFPRALP